MTSLKTLQRSGAEDSAALISQAFEELQSLLDHQAHMKSELSKASKTNESLLRRCLDGVFDLSGVYAQAVFDDGDGEALCLAGIFASVAGTTGGRRWWAAP